VTIPDDPFPEGVSCDDACEAVGMAVLELFADGNAYVIVRETEGGFDALGLEEDQVMGEF
jgi:hypothetical protein